MFPFPIINEFNLITSASIYLQSQYYFVVTYFHVLSSIQCLLIEEVFPQDVWPTGYKSLFTCLSLVVHSSGTWWNLWHVTIYGGLLMKGTFTNHTAKSHWHWLKCLQGTWNSHRNPWKSQPSTSVILPAVNTWQHARQPHTEHQNSLPWNLPHSLSLLPQLSMMQNTPLSSWRRRGLEGLMASSCSLRNPQCQIEGSLNFKHKVGTWAPES